MTPRRFQLGNYGFRILKIQKRLGAHKNPVRWRIVHRSSGSEQQQHENQRDGGDGNAYYQSTHYYYPKCNDNEEPTNGTARAKRLNDLRNGRTRHQGRQDRDGMAMNAPPDASDVNFEHYGGQQGKGPQVDVQCTAAKPLLNLKHIE